MNAENFYLNQPEPNKSCLLALRDLILNYDNAISTTVKYGMPCFTYHNKAVCYLWKDKKTDEPYVLFVEGQKLNHPELQQGDRKRMKVLSIAPNQDIPKATLYEILKDALSLVN